MREKIAMLAALVFAAAGLASFRWPLNDGTITSSFGESRWDHFHDGMDMTAQDPFVYPVEPGALLFFWDRALFPLENYPGGGNYSILEHRNGLCTIYMHLENGMPRKSVYAEDDPVGVMGNTGHSFSRHLHFSLIRPTERTSINPKKLLPPVEDNAPPRIDEIAFRIGDRIVIVRDGSDIRLTRHYPLLVKITDTVSGRGNLGAYRVTALHNGKKALDVEFGSITYSPKGLAVGGMEFDRLFDVAGYYKIDTLAYVEGENRVTVAAADYAGNRTEREFRFSVKLDIQE